MNRNKSKLIAAFSIMGALLLGAGVSSNQLNKNYGVEAADENITCTTGTISNNTMTFIGTNFVINHYKGTDSNFASYSPWRIYTSNYVTFKAKANELITKIEISADSNAYATAAVGGWINLVEDGTSTTLGTQTNDTTITRGTNAKIATITPASGVPFIKLKPSAQTRWVSIKITYDLAQSSKSLSSIALKSGPTKTSYWAGEEFDPSTVVIEATFSDNSKLDVTSFVDFTPSPLTAGTTSVTASYTYGSVTKTTTVSGLTVIVPSFFTVKYVITAKDTLSESGVSPDGSDAALAATYTGNAFQMTNGHSQTLTLTGYTNVKITEIKMSMKSNASGGAGSFKYTVNDGVTYTDIVAGAAFNTASWYGAWSTSYVDVTKTVNINVKSDIEFIIAATANSLYVESYQFKWEPLPPVTSVAVSPKTGTIYSGGTNNKTIQLSASVLPLDAGNKDVNWTTSSASIATVSSSGLVTAVGPGTATITATAADGSGKKDTATITVVAKAISGLSKTGTATKLVYNIGESFDPTGLTFTATYNNGDTAIVNHNQLTFNPATFAGGETQVVASYSGKSVTITGITVNDIELVSLTKSGTLTKTSYFVGDTFDPNGLTFTAHYSDSSSENLSYEEITFDPSVMSFGTTEVVASYLTESTTISGIMVQQIVINSISIKTPATKLAFKLGETF